MKGIGVVEKHLKNTWNPVRNKRSILLSFSKLYWEHPANWDNRSIQASWTGHNTGTVKSYTHKRNISSWNKKDIGKKHTAQTYFPVSPDLGPSDIGFLKKFEIVKSALLQCLFISKKIGSLRRMTFILDF